MPSFTKTSTLAKATPANAAAKRVGQIKPGAFQIGARGIHGAGCDDHIGLVFQRDRIKALQGRFGTRYGQPGTFGCGADSVQRGLGRHGAGKKLFRPLKRGLGLGRRSNGLIQRCLGLIPAGLNRSTRLGQIGFTDRRTGPLP